MGLLKCSAREQSMHISKHTSTALGQGKQHSHTLPRSPASQPARQPASQPTSQPAGYPNPHRPQAAHTTHTCAALEEGGPPGPCHLADLFIGGIKVDGVVREQR